MIKAILVAAFTFSGVVGAAAQSTDVTMVRAPSMDAFQAAFCGASRSSAHIFVVPLNIFEDGAKMSCSFGDYTMRMTEPSDDPGHVVLNIDPPSGVADAFDCDAKADIGMAEVALNCLPANAETVDHRKT